MARFLAVPVDMAEANRLVVRWHRRHGRVPGYKLALAAVETAGRRLCGVVVLGRPVNRHLDDGWTLEVLRLAGDGTPHLCSFLYGAAARAATAAGYLRLVTYTLAAEPGTSLRAAGWQAVAEVHGRSWSCPARPRPGAVKGEAKVRWERQLGERPEESRAVWLGLARPTEPAPLEALWAA
ncbi:MAG: XF1762 family protein [Parvibaculaceae bacterium]